MSLALSTQLQTAQDGELHNPIIEIISSEGVPDIPFAGELLTSSIVNEQNPAKTAHSSGRLCIAYMRGPYGGGALTYDLIYGYTDIARTEWHYVTLVSANSRSLGEVALCELTAGTVGIIYTDITAGTCATKYRVVTVDGLSLTPAVTGTIFSQASSIYMSGPHVIRLAANTYLMAYGLYDGASHYHLYARTSANFTTWWAATELDTSAVDPGPVPAADTKRKGNPYLLEISAGNLLLLFDALEATGPSGEELTNCYYMVYAGAAWGAAAALTTYADYATTASHPTAALKAGGSITIAYNKEMASLLMSSSAPGWRGTNYTRDMHLDTATGKLYVVTASSTAFGGFFDGVNEIGVSAWSLLRAWDETTAPPFDTELTSGAGYWKRWKGAGQYAIAGDCSHNIIDLLDATANTVTSYYFRDVGGHAQNVTWDGHGGSFGVNAACVDATAMRIYVLMIYNAYGHDGDAILGYLDITTGDWTELYYSPNIPLHSDGLTVQMIMSGSISLHVFPAADIIVANWDGSSVGIGATVVWNLTSGSIWKLYSDYLNGDYPVKGLLCVTHYDDKLYGGITYTGSGDDADKRGLCIIDLLTDHMTFSRPDWASADNYGLCDAVVTEDDKIVFAAFGYGATLYDPATDSWILYSNDTVPGLTPGNESFYQIEYDPATQMIYAGVSFGSGWMGIVAFSRNGNLKQSQYTIGTIAGGVFSGSAPDNIVQGYLDYDAALAVAGGDLYALWVNDAASEYSLKWAKDETDIDLGPYIVRGQANKIDWEIDPFDCIHESTLQFTVARGDLFDTTNSVSLLRGVLAVGRTVTVRFGEKVGVTDYWQNQGTFKVTQNPLDYGNRDRDNHPTMLVTAEDPSVTWDQDKVKTTDHYTASSPEVILADILADQGEIAPGDIVLGTWTNTTNLTHQWIDISLKDIVAQLCQRYGYYVRWNVNGTVDARRIYDAAAVDHVYATLDALINYSTGKRDNDFINRVVIEAEELDYIEVLTAEERVASFNASHRWNTGKKDYTIWYSDDRSRRCKYPRMVVGDSVTSLMFALAGGCSEDLIDDSHSQADQNLWDKYCTIEVDSPDLTPEFAAAMAGLVGSFWTWDWVNTVGSHTIRWGTYISTFFIMLALNILAATGNFSAEIWAQPLGYVRRKVQSADSDDTNDYEFQVKIGKTITETEPNPLCYSASDCNVVAAHRMMCHKRGRNPIAFGKASHLQDEAGDTISVLHPRSGDTVKVFITKLSRSWTITKEPGDNQGLCIDTIEGWAL